MGSGKLQILYEGKDENNQKEAILGMECKCTLVPHSLKRRIKYISERHDWLAEFTGTDVGKNYKCCNLKICSDYFKLAYLQ